MNKRFLYCSIVIFLLSACATSRKVQVIQDALSKKDSINTQLLSEKTKIDSGIIVKNIIEKHYSKIYLVSEVGVGTTFWFDLDIYQASKPSLELSPHSQLMSL